MQRMKDLKLRILTIKSEVKRYEGKCSFEFLVKVFGLQWH